MLLTANSSSVLLAEGLKQKKEKKLFWRKIVDLLFYDLIITFV
jgi:hypothetical protein